MNINTFKDIKTLNDIKSIKTTFGNEGIFEAI